MLELCTPYMNPNTCCIYLVVVTSFFALYYLFIYIIKIYIPIKICNKLFHKLFNS